MSNDLPKSEATIPFSQPFSVTLC